MRPTLRPARPAIRHRRLLAVLLCVPLLAACTSGTADPDPALTEEPTAAGGSAAGGSDSPGQDAVGETRTVSVASVTLPGGPWSDEVSAAVEDLDESHFALGSSDESGCAVTLSVQSEFEGTMESYKTFVEALNGDAAKISDDDNAPDGAEGMLARIDRTEEGDNPFTSIIRTWLTPGGTKITMSAVAPGAQPDPACDLEAIAGSLQWTGAERPVG